MRIDIEMIKDQIDEMIEEDHMKQRKLAFV
jgi:hypothetical protein